MNFRLIVAALDFALESQFTNLKNANLGILEKVLAFSFCSKYTRSLLNILIVTDIYINTSKILVPADDIRSFFCKNKKLHNT